MKLSIITINLNNADGLRLTIESVLSQTFLDYEFIVIDGNSSDGSLEVIKLYSPKITRWISEHDTGVYQAMNKGIRIASGEYLLFLNSGDYLVDKMVLSQVFEIKQTADILCGRSNIIDKGKIIHTTNPPVFHTFATYFKTTINHQASFIRRYLFEKYGFYREDFKINSDWEFWIRTIILNNCTTQKLDVIISNYNLEGMSSIPDYEKLRQEEEVKVLSHPVLSRFVPDYETWYIEKSEMKIMYWVKSKKLLYLPLVFIYKMADRYAKIKKLGHK